ncbi:hypothetical protein Tco_0115698 [Tanacetum coccineum]
MDENPEFEMDNAVWTPTEAGTQAQGMDLVRERVDEDLVEPEPGISSSTYRDNAKRRSRFQQQPVKTKEPRRPKGWSLTQKQYEKQVLSVPKLVIVESQGSLRDRTGVFGCLLELSVTPPGAKAVEGKSVKIDYRVEDGISAIESLKFPPVGSSKYGFEVNFPYSIFFRYRSKDRDVPEVVSRKVSSVYAKAEEELVGNERVSHRERGGRRGSSLCCTSSWIGWIF